MRTRSGRPIGFLIAWVLVLPGFAQQDEASAPQEPAPLSERALAVSDLDAWREYVRPDRDELAAEALPWLPDFPSGLKAAAEERRPLLLWTMNGHPLGCT